MDKKVFNAIIIIFVLVCVVAAVSFAVGQGARVVSDTGGSVYIAPANLPETMLKTVSTAPFSSGYIAEIEIGSDYKCIYIQNIHGIALECKVYKSTNKPVNTNLGAK